MQGSSEAFVLNMYLFICLFGVLVAARGGFTVARGSFIVTGRIFES